MLVHTGHATAAAWHFRVGTIWLSGRCAWQHYQLRFSVRSAPATSDPAIKVYHGNLSVRLWTSTERPCASMLRDLEAILEIVRQAAAAMTTACACTSSACIKDCDVASRARLSSPGMLRTFQQLACAVKIRHCCPAGALHLPSQRDLTCSATRGPTSPLHIVDLLHAVLPSDARHLAALG